MGFSNCNTPGSPEKGIDLKNHNNYQQPIGLSVFYDIKIPPRSFPNVDTEQ